jgi:hypothetical protein
MTETITGVALLRDDGALWSLPKPNRHHHLFSLAAFMGEDTEPCKQGFTTSYGRFLDRIDALAIAKAANQPIRKNGNIRELYSEDLW